MKPARNATPLSTVDAAALRRITAGDHILGGIEGLDALFHRLQQLVLGNIPVIRRP
jgi:hypothetical protein